MVRSFPQSPKSIVQQRGAADSAKDPLSPAARRESRRGRRENHAADRPRGRNGRHDVADRDADCTG